MPVQDASLSSLEAVVIDHLQCGRVKAQYLDGRLTAGEDLDSATPDGCHARHVTAIAHDVFCGRIAARKLVVVAKVRQPDLAGGKEVMGMGNRIF